MKFKSRKSRRSARVSQPISDEQVAEKTWGMIDETIEPSEVEALANSLLASKQARENYIDAVQLHMDLISILSNSAD